MQDVASDERRLTCCGKSEQEFNTLATEEIRTGEELKRGEIGSGRAQRGHVRIGGGGPCNDDAGRG